MITVTNKTMYPQSIHTFDGNTFTIERDVSFDIDPAKFFPEEIERIKKFFQVSEKKEQEKDIARATSKRKYDYDDGGKE